VYSCNDSVVIRIGQNTVIYLLYFCILCFVHQHHNFIAVPVLPVLTIVYLLHMNVATVFPSHYNYSIMQACFLLPYEYLMVLLFFIFHIVIMWYGQRRVTSTFRNGVVKDGEGYLCSLYIKRSIIVTICVLIGQCL